jgi:hypothetical protein
MCGYHDIIAWAISVRLQTPLVDYLDILQLKSLTQLIYNSIQQKLNIYHQLTQSHCCLEILSFISSSYH